MARYPTSALLLKMDHKEERGRKMGPDLDQLGGMLKKARKTGSTGIRIGFKVWAA